MNTFIDEKLKKIILGYPTFGDKIYINPDLCGITQEGLDVSFIESEFVDNIDEATCIPIFLDTAPWYTSGENKLTASTLLTSKESSKLISVNNFVSTLNSSLPGLSDSELENVGELLLSKDAEAVQLGMSLIRSCGICQQKQMVNIRALSPVTTSLYRNEDGIHLNSEGPALTDISLTNYFLLLFYNKIL